MTNGFSAFGASLGWKTSYLRSTGGTLVLKHPAGQLCERNEHDTKVVEQLTLRAGQFEYRSQARHKRTLHCRQCLPAERPPSTSERDTRAGKRNESSHGHTITV